MIRCSQTLARQVLLPSAIVAVAALVAIAAGCAAPGQGQDRAAGPAAGPSPEYFGTREPFTARPVYFVVTDRFVDGDPGNNQRSQGGDQWGTFDRLITDAEGRQGNIGYQGGDFRGLLDHAGYIAEMGFGAVWITPVVDNPNEAFSGGFGIGEGMFADHGKTGYHGYWGVNFYRTDEHLPSEGLGFSELTARLQQDHGLVTILDIVANHGSPSFTMPVDQPMYGEIYDASGSLVADHQNLHPNDLSDSNPLHAFFQKTTDLGELSNIDDSNPEVVDYFVDAYSQWIERGAGAFRVDTIAHVSHEFWKTFSDRIRARYPGFFMFGESFSYDAARIAQHTWPENGNISVLDFPGKAALNEVFGNPQSDFSELLDYLHLDDGLYQNPYELMTFYDNHDMPRMQATNEGFINAHNWLFTSRGIPVIYYGSEMAFRAGMPEHGGNRDYFGPQRIEAARRHPIRAGLKQIAEIRRSSPALQRGLQVNLDFSGHTAAFLRVLSDGDVNETALVLLNKGSEDAVVPVDRWLDPGNWRDALSGDLVAVNTLPMRWKVPAHGVRVLLRNQPVSDPGLRQELSRLHNARLRPASAAAERLD